MECVNTISIWTTGGSYRILGHNFRNRQEGVLAMYRVVVRQPASGNPDRVPGNFDLEMEALGPLDGELTEVFTDDDDEVLLSAREADAIYVHRARLSRYVIENLTKCRLIATGSVGTDLIDLRSATEMGIPVSNVPDTFIEEVADHAMVLILSAYRRLTLLDQMSRSGRWSEGRSLLYNYPRLWGMTLGLISFGHIARAVAHRAAPFGFRILAHDPYVGELSMTRAGVEPVGLVELLQGSDIVSHHAPSTRETYHMMGEQQFRLMKPHSIFFNTGRGETVDEGALVKALQEKWIGMAGVDVLETEPVESDNPLLGMENIIITPHVASASARMEPERRRRVGREIALVLQGRWPRACVNPSVLEKSDLVRWKPYSMD